MIATMDQREATVLKMRFGLGDFSPHTLKEIGEQLGLTRERVRQIESKAVRKLQQPYRARSLASFVDGLEIPAEGTMTEPVGP